jgi:hypothetical protein
MKLAVQCAEGETAPGGFVPFNRDVQYDGEPHDYTCVFVRALQLEQIAAWLAEALPGGGNVEFDFAASTKGVVDIEGTTHYYYQRWYNDQGKTPWNWMCLHEDGSFESNAVPSYSFKLNNEVTSLVLNVKVRSPGDPKGRSE